MHILIERLIQANSLILMDTKNLNSDQLFEVQNLQRKQKARELEENAEQEHEGGEMDFEGGDR